MSEKWTKASFRVTSSSDNPNAITEVLGIEPSQALDRPSGESVWILNSELPTSASADEHIEWILARLRPHVKGLQGVDGVRDIFLGFASDNGQGGMSLSAPLLGELAKNGIDLVLDLYPSEDANTVLES